MSSWISSVASYFTGSTGNKNYETTNYELNSNNLKQIEKDIDSLQESVKESGKFLCDSDRKSREFRIEMSGESDTAEALRKSSQEYQRCIKKFSE